MQPCLVYLSVDPKSFRIQRDIILGDASHVPDCIVAHSPEPGMDTPESALRIKQSDLFIAIIGDDLPIGILTEIEHAHRTDRVMAILVREQNYESLHVRGLRMTLGDQVVRPFTDSGDLVAHALELMRSRAAAKVRSQRSEIIDIATASSNFGQFAVEHLHGREDDIKTLLGWIARTPSGYQVVTGLPGVGKTSLLAALARSVPSEIHYVGLSITGHFEGSPALVLDNLIRQLVPLTGPDYVRDVADVTLLSSSLYQAIFKASQYGHKLVVIIDGVDQGIDQTSHRRLVEYLPHPLPEGVHFILSTREPSLDRKYDWEKFPLKPLGEDAALAMLKDLDLPRNVLIQVYAKAQGLPIYLYRLLNDIKYGLLSIRELPDGIPNSFMEYLHDLLKRVRKEDRALLGAIAATRRPISIQDLALVTSTSYYEVHQQIQRLESLVRSPIVGAYALFHLTVKETILDQLGQADARDLHDRLAKFLGPNHPDYSHHLFHAERFADLIEFTTYAFNRIPQSPDGLQDMRSALTYAFRACKKQNDAKRALTLALQLSLLSELEYEGVPVDILTWLARYGHPEKALARAQNLRDPKKLTTVYLGIAEALTERADYKALFANLIERTVTAARSLPQEQFSDLADQVVQLVLNHDPELALPLLEELLAVRDSNWSALVHLVQADVGAAKRMLRQLKRAADRAFYLSLISMVAWVSFDELKAVYDHLQDGTIRLLTITSFCLTQERHCTAGQVSWLHAELESLSSEPHHQLELDGFLLRTLMYMVQYNKCYDFTNPGYVWTLVSRNPDPTERTLCLAHIITLSRQHCPSELTWLRQEAQRVATDAPRGSMWGLALCELGAALSHVDAPLAQEVTLSALAILEGAGSQELSIAGNFIVPAASALSAVSIEAVLMLVQTCPYDWQIGTFIRSTVSSLLNGTAALPQHSLRDVLDLVHSIDERTPSPELYLYFVTRTITTEGLLLEHGQALVAEAMAAIAGTAYGTEAYLTLAKASHKKGQPEAVAQYLRDALDSTAALTANERSRLLLEVGVTAMQLGTDSEWARNTVDYALQLYASRQLPIDFMQLWLLANTLNVPGVDVDGELPGLLAAVEQLEDANQRMKILCVIGEHSLAERGPRFSAVLAKIWDTVPQVTEPVVLQAACNVLARSLRIENLERALFIVHQLPPDYRAPLGAALLLDEINDPNSYSIQRVLLILNSFASDEDKRSLTAHISTTARRDLKRSDLELRELADALTTWVTEVIPYEGYRAAATADVAVLLGKVDRSKAEPLLHRALAATRRVANRSDRVVCLHRIALGASGLGLTDLAKEAAEGADREAVQLPLRSERIYRGIEVVDALRTVGETKRAKSLAQQLLTETNELNDHVTASTFKASIVAAISQLDDELTRKEVQRLSDPMMKKHVTVALVAKHSKIVEARKHLLSLRGQPEEIPAFHKFVDRLWRDDSETVTVETLLGLLEQGIDLGLSVVSRLVLLAFKRQLVVPSLAEFRDYLNAQSGQIHALVKELDREMMSEVLGGAPRAVITSALALQSPTGISGKHVICVAPNISVRTIAALRKVAQISLTVLTGSCAGDPSPYRVSSPTVDLLLIETAKRRFPIGHSFVIVDGTGYKVIGGLDAANEPVQWTLVRLSDWEAEGLSKMVSRLKDSTTMFTGQRIRIQRVN